MLFAEVSSCHHEFNRHFPAYPPLCQRPFPARAVAGRRSDVRLDPQPLAALGGFIDVRTLITLLGLMLLTKGVEVSGYFDFVGRKIINRLHSERRLALFLVFSAALLSSFLTNDVALFIVIPLTITLKSCRRCRLAV